MCWHVSAGTCSCVCECVCRFVLLYVASRCTSFDSSEVEGLSGEEGEVTVAAGLEAVWTEGKVRHFCSGCAESQPLGALTFRPAVAGRRAWLCSKQQPQVLD